MSRESKAVRFLGEAAVVGVTSVAVAAGLQALYKATKYYPPKPVFWGAIGVSTFALLEVTGINRRFEKMGDTRSRIGSK